jgi:hypothetical protein
MTFEIAVPEGFCIVRKKERGTVNGIPKKKKIK